MHIGSLRNLIQIKKWQDVPVGAFAIKQDIENILQVWAHIEGVGNNLFWGTQQIGSGITHRITCRKIKGVVDDDVITAEHIIDYENKRFRVKRAYTDRQNAQYLKIEVELLNAT